MSSTSHGPAGIFAGHSIPELKLPSSIVQHKVSLQVAPKDKEGVRFTDRADRENEGRSTLEVQHASSEIGCVVGETASSCVSPTSNNASANRFMKDDTIVSSAESIESRVDMSVDALSVHRDSARSVRVKLRLELNGLNQNGHHAFHICVCCV